MKSPLSMAAVVLTSACLVAPPVLAQQKPPVQIPDPGVPQIMTMEGRWVRAAVQQRRLCHPGIPARQPVAR